jgi:FlaA1/EpsC-like NDP-sugar epimerase
MFERYENSLHDIRMELQDLEPSFGLYAIVGDVTDQVRVGAALREHLPQIIFHAAAHKHVPLMEENPCEAIKNNVRGTRLLAKLAEANGVDRFILISTDKAVNPTSVMGASKRLAELVVRAQAHGSGTSFSIVRFGNVLGSNGSVVPRFMDQIRKGGPVTITHPEMRRFFMLIPEAVQLVLHAASHAESGATYILEMGEQVRLVDMARDMIRLAGLSPDDIKIKFIGMRPGEKLSEELVGPDEQAGPSTVDKVLCVRGQWRQGADFLAQIESLEALAARGRNAAVVAAMKDLVGMGVQPEMELAQRPPHRVSNAFSAPLDPVCPSCTSGRLLRSRTRTIGERVRKEFTADRPYRCDSCEWRGWLQPPRVGAQSPIEPLAIPDLSRLDHATPAHAGDRRASFSPRDLR